MVDDLPHNVRGAVAAGMVGVLHRSYAETLLELEALFDVPLAPPPPPSPSGSGGPDQKRSGPRS
jgi:FMN phosphatase YigB (HAD superfamily)